jgi:hypothetical protein
MSNVYNGGIYTFSFKLSGSLSIENISDSFFKKLHSSDDLKSLLTDHQYSVYETILLFKEHEEEGYNYKTIDGLERIVDNEDGEFLIGFACSRRFTTDELKDLYIHVVTPIMIASDVACSPTGGFSEHHEVIERTYQNHTISFS